MLSQGNRAMPQSCRNHFDAIVQECVYEHGIYFCC